MNRKTLERLAPLTGVVFFALLVVNFVLTWNTPGTNDSASSVVSYWHDHHTKLTVGALIGGIAVVFFVWFAGVLRARLAAAEGGTGRLATTAFGGALLIAVGGGIFSSLTFAAADVAGKSNVPASVVQTLSIMNNDFFFVLAAGAAVALIATGVASLRFGAMPRWLAWVAVVIGILAVTPVGFFAFLALLLWVLVASIWLYTSQPAAATP